MVSGECYCNNSFKFTTFSQSWFFFPCPTTVFVLFPQDFSVHNSSPVPSSVNANNILLKATLHTIVTLHEKHYIPFQGLLPNWYRYAKTKTFSWLLYPQLLHHLKNALKPFSGFQSELLGFGDYFFYNFVTIIDRFFLQFGVNVVYDIVHLLSTKYIIVFESWAMSNFSDNYE